MINTHTVSPKQFELEQRGRAAGAERFDARLASAQESGREDGTGYGVGIISSSIVEVAAMLERVRNPEGRGRPPAALKLLDGVSYGVAAQVALSVAFSAASKTRGLASLAGSIGSALEVEAQRVALSEDALRRVVYSQREYNLHGRDLKRAIDKAAEAVDNGRLDWGRKRRIELGRLMMEIIIEATGAFEIEEGDTSETKKGKSAQYVYIPTAAFLDKIEKHKEETRFLTPTYLNMADKPRKWSRETLRAGAYWTTEQAPLPFVKRNISRQFERLNNERVERVFAAVNLAQEVPLMIRPQVLKLLRRLDCEKIDLGLKPGSFPCPLDMEEDPDAPVWQQRAIKQENQERRSLRANFRTILTLAEEFAELDRFYCPYHLDTRGRLYAVAPLNFQGSDYVKGLLGFAEGKAITEEGIPWLKIHTAGLFGVDKVSFEDRIKWVDDNWGDLLESAFDPLNNTFWVTADKPIQAYAACLELAGVAVDGPAHICRMPIALDGSCSGLQHLGAAFRCERTAKAVNLIPGDLPNDIYRDVAELVQADVDGYADQIAEAVQKDLEERVEEGDRTFAREWLSFCDGKITRKLTKRAVMTFPYGSSAPGFADQLLKDWIKPAEKKGAKPFANRSAAARYLALLIEKAVSNVVLKAAEAMRWMQDYSKLISLSNKPIEWTTPLGFPVVHDYRKTDARRIDSVLFGKRMRQRYNEETDEIDSRKAANAIAPNVVHSLDSTHLLLTVLRAGEEGITDLALIHDSFGTHPADTPRLFSLVRETFVELYKEDVFQNLADEWEAQIDPALIEKKKKAIPMLPIKGRFDLDLTLESLYAFA